MTINPHMTDQILASVDQAHARHAKACNEHCGQDGNAQDVADALTNGLPGIDVRLLGEVLLHTGSAVGTVVNLALKAYGWNWPAATQSAIDSMVNAGALLYRKGSEAKATAAEQPTVEDIADVVDVLGAAMVKSRGRASLSVGYGIEDGAGVFTVLLFDNGPESFDVMGRMPGDGQTTVLAHGQASTLAEALILCAVSTAGA